MSICGDAARYIIEPEGKDIALCANHLSKGLEQFASPLGDSEVKIKILRPLVRYPGKGPGKWGSLRDESKKRRLPCEHSRPGEQKNSFRMRYENRNRQEVQEKDNSDEQESTSGMAPESQSDSLPQPGS
jgi:hypothetical protein